MGELGVKSGFEYGEGNKDGKCDEGEEREIGGMVG